MSPTVAVTGAARGIGLACAERLALSGHAVALGDLDAEGAERAAASLRATGAPITAHHLDVRDPGSTSAFVSHAEATLGPLEVVIANAGVMFVGPFLDERPEAMRTQFEVNVIGVGNTARATLPAMRERGRGHLIVVASAASWLAPPGEASYCASKHAVRGLSRALRTELAGSGISISLLCPGVVDTELARGTHPGRTRLLHPGEVADAIIALIQHPRDEVFLPRQLGLIGRVWSALPPRAAGRVSRLLGLDAVAADVDPGARAAYEAGLTGPRQHRPRSERTDRA